MLTYKSDTLTVSRKTGNKLVRAVRADNANRFTICLNPGIPLVSASVNSGPHSVYIGDRYIRDISMADVLATARLYVDCLRLRKQLVTADTMFIRPKGE